MAYNGAGIYGIFNIVDNSIYIGKSEHISNRIRQHKSCFRRKSGSNIMYQEPIEKFVFFVILKMSDIEYKQYGDLFEALFIIQAREMKYGYKLYNSSRAKDSALWDVLCFYGILDSVRLGIKNATGYDPGIINLMKNDTRKELVKQIKKEERKYW